MDGRTPAIAAETPPPIAMLQLISGFWISRCTYVAAKLGIADLIKDGPKTAAELAAATDTDEPSLFRCLRALASVGVLSHNSDNRFATTPLLETLRSGLSSDARGRDRITV